MMYFEEVIAFILRYLKLVDKFPLNWSLEMSLNSIAESISKDFGGGCLFFYGYFVLIKKDFLFLFFWRTVIALVSWFIAYLTKAICIYLEGFKVA